MKDGTELICEGQGPTHVHANWDITMFTRGVRSVMQTGTHSLVIASMSASLWGF